MSRIAFLGTGVMGRSMARHLAAKHGHVALYNRTAAKAASLADELPNASAHGSVAEACAGADFVCTMLGMPADVEAVYGDIAKKAEPADGAVLIDFTTSKPSLAASIAEGSRFPVIDAPVSGGDKGAQNAALAIMVGCEDEAVFDRAKREIFDHLGRAVRFGGPGQGQHVKAANQTLIAGAMIGLCEGMVYARRVGLDVEKVLELLATGAAGSKSLDLYGHRMLARDFEPGFMVEHFVKDLRIVLDECNAIGLRLPGLQLTELLYSELSENMKLGKKGTQSLLLALEAANGMVEFASEQ